MGAPGFWDHQDRAQKHIAKTNSLKKAVLPVVAFRKQIEDIDVMLELIETGSEAEVDEYTKELVTTVDALAERLGEVEIGAFLTGQFDANNAFLSIQAGAGGTESNDWADMMFRSPSATTWGITGTVSFPAAGLPGASCFVVVEIDDPWRTFEEANMLSCIWISWEILEISAIVSPSWPQ